MKVSQPIFLLASSLLLSCAIGPTHRSTVQRNWPAQGIDSIRVDSENGTVSVQAGDVQEIFLTARIHSIGKAPEREHPNEGYFNAAIQAGTLTIAQPRLRQRGGYFLVRRSKVDIDYHLIVPRALAVDLATVNGTVIARGVEGAADLSTVNGQIDAEVAGSHGLTARAVNGRVQVRFVKQFAGASLKTINGAVEVSLPQSASFTCNLSQVNGVFESSFPLSIHSHPRSRRVSGEVNGGRYELKITTINGDVEVERLPGGTPLTTSSAAESTAGGGQAATERR